MKKLLLFLFITLFAAFQLNAIAATRTASQTGNWNATSTWGGSSFPVSGDTVIINGNYTITINVSGAACNSLVVGAASGNGISTLSFNSGSSLTVSGNVTIGNSTTKKGVITMISGGIFTVGGSFSLVNGGTFTSGTGTGTVVYNGAAQVLLGTTYNNLTLSGSGAKTTTGATINGILSMEGTATTTGTAPGFGTSSTLQYNRATSLTAGVEWVTPFPGTGGIIITNAGAITINAAKVLNASVPLTINSGATLNTGNFALTVGGTFNNSGTFNAGTGIVTFTGTFTNTGTFNPGATGTINFNDGSDTVPPNTYFNLTLSGSGVKTISGVTVNGVLSMEGTATISTTPIYGAAATLQYKGSGSVTTTVNEFPDAFAGTGGVIIDQGTGNTITLNANKTALAGNLNIKSGTLDLSTFTINRVSNTLTLTIAGTLKLGATSGGQTGSNFPSGFTTLTMTGGTVEYSTSSGAQTIYSTPVYNNLILDNTSGSNTADGNLTVNGILTTSSGGILNMNTFTLGGTLASVTNSGTLSTSNTSSTPIPTGKTWGGTVIYAAATGTQTVISGTYNILTLSNSSGTNTAVGNLVVNGALTTSSGGILNLNTFTLGGTLVSVTNSGTLSTSNTSSTPIPTGKTWGGTVIYAVATGTQTVRSGTYNILTLSNSSGTNTVSGNLATTTLNNTNGGILDMAGFTLSGSISNTSSTIRFNGASNGLAVSTGTIVYYGATQTVATGTYSALTLSGSGSKTIAGVIVNGILSMEGTATASAAPIYGGSAILQYKGSGSQTTGSELPASINNLTIYNPNGVALSGNTIVNGTFALTSGNISLGTNNLTVSSISGGSSTSYVITNGIGTLIQNVGTSPVTFPIGLVASDYTPITFSNTGTPQNYNVRIRSVTPSLSTSGLDRQWIVKETSASTTILSLVTLTWTATSAYTLGNPSSCDMVENITGSVDPYYAIKIGLDGTTSSVTTGSMSYPLGDITTGLYVTLVGQVGLVPVELSTFTSAVNGRNISLNWETKTEKNSDRFVIERTKTDAAAVTLNWETVTSVKAAVLSNSPKQYFFTDKNLQSGIYQYRLKMIDNDGSFAYSKIVEADITLPKNFELSQNYPNPFNPTTKINYSLPNDSKVTLEVYNIIGERVAQLVNQEQSAGYYVVNFGTSSNNISSGIYIYKLTAVDNTGMNFSSIKKMMLLK
jgi:hypothetical protein